MRLTGPQDDDWQSTYGSKRVNPVWQALIYSSRLSAMLCQISYLYLFHLLLIKQCFCRGSVAVPLSYDISPDEDLDEDALAL
jgi:hypothetical protein